MKIYNSSYLKYIILLIFLLGAAAFAQSYSPGLPLPGLPNSLGPKLMTGSTSVTIATNQTAIPITGNITASNASVGLNFFTAPTSSNEVGFIDSNGILQPFRGSANGGITVTALQGTNPWTVSGGVAITNTPTVNQGSNPWIIAGGVAITSSASTVVTQGTIPWISAVTGTVTANQGTNPWISAITGTVTSVPVTYTANTITRVANAVTNATLLSANLNRKGIFLFNDSATTNCYVKFGATASLTSFTVKMFATDTYIMDSPTYMGIIDYICDAASGNMEVNEQ